MAYISFGPWRPDTPDNDEGSCVEATNVVPAVGSFAPQPALSPFSTALDLRCRGALATASPQGAVQWFAGDALDLYTINTSTVDWTRVSRQPHAHPYSLSSDGQWSFAAYGDAVYAADFNDPIQVCTLGVGNTFNDLDDVAPRAANLAVVRNFLVASNTVDTDGPVPQRVRWSGLDQPLSWSIDSVTQADFNDLLGLGGTNQGVFPGLSAADAVVLQERAAWRMTYTGPPLVFQFDPIEGARGTPSPHSVVVVGGLAYYLGEDGFYVFDGAQSQPIGAGKIDRTFFADIDSIYFDRISAAADISRKLIFWAYPSKEAAGIPDKVLVYNWGTGEWSRLRIETEFVLQTLGFGYDLDHMDGFGTLEDFVVSFDANQWLGGVWGFSAFDSSHRLCHFSGPPLGVTLVTAENLMPDPRRHLVTQTWPIVECASATADIAISVGHRVRAADPVVWAPATHPNPVGFCPQRISDHYTRFRVSISAGASWSKALGVDVYTGVSTSRR